jgi:hypothetical protein
VSNLFESHVVAEWIDKLVKQQISLTVASKKPVHNRNDFLLPREIALCHRATVNK